jgi:hypothetical protein
LGEWLCCRRFAVRVCKAWLRAKRPTGAAITIPVTVTITITTTFTFTAITATARTSWMQ